MKKSCWILGLCAVALVLTGCPEKRRPAGSSTPPKPEAAAPKKTDTETKAPGPLADYGKNLVNAEKKATEVTGLTSLTQAVQQFGAIEGRFPRNLDELIAGRYLLKLPRAPRGKRFAYDASNGKIELESVPDEAPAPETPAAEPAP